MKQHYQSRQTLDSSGLNRTAISARVWRIYIQVWLVSLLFPIASLVQSRRSAVELIVPIVGLVMFVGFYIWSMEPHPITSTPDRIGFPVLRLIVIFLVTLCVLFLSATYGIAFLWLLVGTSAVAGKSLPIRTAHLATILLPIITLLAGVALSGGIEAADWLHLIPLILLMRALGVDMIGLSLLSGMIRDLHLAREELAHRAVVEERLRLARDLHDLLGHTLSLIVLKSELSGRLMDKEPARAAQELQDLEMVARQALREVRQAVAGYRQPMLLSELDGARQMLDSAGIACMINNTSRILPQQIDSVLGWTVREAVTNVIRHSRARSCMISITEQPSSIRAEIMNDGYMGEEKSQSNSGSGISGIAERVTSQGGQIQAGPYSSGAVRGFRLIVEIPVQKTNEQKEVLL